MNRCEFADASEEARDAACERPCLHELLHDRLFALDDTMCDHTILSVVFDCICGVHSIARNNSAYIHSTLDAG